MQARFYDPALGRFLQPDPIVPGPANPQTLNRYSYVGNNPLRYTDPTGLCWGWDRVCDAAGAVGGAISSGASMGVNFFTDTLAPGVQAITGNIDACIQNFAACSTNAMLQGVDIASSGAHHVKNAGRKVASTVASGAGAVWESPPVEAAREYVADKSQDVGVFAVATVRDPATLPQNLVALGFSFTTVGDRRGSYNGFVAYENSTGLASAILNIPGVAAFTPGNITFHEDTFSPYTYWHEYRHFQQSQALGNYYLPAYLTVNAAVLGNRNLHPMERQADAYGKQHQSDPLPWE